MQLADAAAVAVAVVSFYPSTPSTAIILSVPILPPREMQALWSQNHGTEMLD